MSYPGDEDRGAPTSVPVLDVVLDPDAKGEQNGAGEAADVLAAPARAALIGAVAGLGVILTTFVVLFALDPTRRRFLVDAARHSASANVQAVVAPHAPAASAAPAPPAPTPAIPELVAPQPTPGPWRLGLLAGAPDIKIVEGTMDRRPFVETLASSGVPRNQIYRLIAAFSGIRKFDRTRKQDGFSVALEQPSRKIRAFEYQAGPTEIYQARTREDGALVAERLDLHVERKRAVAAVVVGDDLGSSLKSAGFDPALMNYLDDALEGRTELSSLRPGSRLRVVADYETALGAFARYIDVPAVELLVDQAHGALRVYKFRGDKAEGYFDAKGHQPYKGGFRRPIPFARISSRFNLHRMHPILHRVMPHNGVDFAASAGTPVYAACSGRVEWIGDGGPSGNLVTIRHAAGITTGYAHLSRFAPHLSAGQAVETRQLIGYVGSTGRSTGPHLHFSAKRNGVFIDPLSLKLDGDRVLAKPERAGFEEQRSDMDKILDAIPLPAVSEQAESHTAEPPEGEAMEPMEEER